MTEQRYVGMVNGVEVPWTPEQIAQWEAEADLRQPKPTLGEKLDSIFSGLPVEIRAKFSPLKAGIKLELDQGDLEVAKEIIKTATVPSELEAVRQSLLSQFP